MKHQTLDIDGRRVPVSNLDKVLYPAAGFTKAHVIDYYIRCSRWLLPHLRDRPVTLKRYPDGVTGEHFYEKDAPSFTPSWVATYPVPRRAGGPDIRYIVINDLPTLVWAANLANLEIHPFLHRIPELDTPTYVAFDLDPGEGVDIRACAEVAGLLKDIFDNLGLKSFAKVSGSKGVQVYVPLHTSVTYETTRTFARTLAQLLEKQHPALIVSDMDKSLRKKKVFIDWSQNSDYKTTVGVYSLRAKRATPFVSAPVTWDELQRAKDLHFDPEEALERLEQFGDVWAALLNLKQTLPGTEVTANPPPKGLATYHAKRNFTKTSEPAAAHPVPRRSSQGGRRRFVIQKHAASHLHYDFRLEMHDVLKSWAVPKGVPYEIDEKRLAMATEDHPIEYLDFEGIIPEGQYGGGTVMVWDIGTYELIEGNYYKGTLHIHLSGKKLKGEWMLVRDRAKGERNWLMTKAPPAAKRASAKQEDSSALTGRTMAQIAAARDAEWQSNRAPASQALAKLRHKSPTDVDLSAFPKRAASFIEPMQAKLVPMLPEGEQWSYEGKFDGYRVVALRTEHGVRLLSRNNNDLTKDFPTVTQALYGLPDETIVDGEIVALDEQGRPAFNLLQNRSRGAGIIHYYVFDVPVLRGHSLIHASLATRRELLSSALTNVEDTVKISRPLMAEPEELIEAVRETGLEGIVAKRIDSHYEVGKRSGSWVKYKVNKDQELVIGGYIPASKRHFDSLLVGYYDQNGRLLFAGKIRNGFGDPGSKERVFAQFKGLGTNKCPFANLPEPANARRGLALTEEAMKICCWLRPKLVAQVGIREWTADGHLRHSGFLGLRNDKDARDVVRERA